MGENVRALRVLVELDGQLLRLCKVGFSASDASLYLHAFGPSGRYFFGRHVLPAGAMQSTIRVDDQERSSLPPKLSIHETGRVHVRSEGQEAGPMLGTPLGELGGHHIATMTCSRFAGLAPYPRAPRTSGSERDLAIPARGAESGRLRVYANATEPSFEVGCPVVGTLRRPTLLRPFYVGFSPVAQAPLGEEATVTVIAGWDPLDLPPLSEPAEHLFIVAR
ncbi:MAG: hypothetical protein ACRDHU_02365 [Actinomycetota bacterium]